MRIEIPNFDRGRPVVLCLASLQFNRDVEALSTWSTKYTWAAIMDTFLTDTQEQWVPRRLQDQAVYVNEAGSDVDAAWAKSKRFALGILRQFVSSGAKLTAVLSGNWDYWNEECMRLACDEVGLPFLVLMREHDLTGIRKRVADEFYGSLKRIPHVTAVAGAGQATHDLLREIDLFPPSKIRVTGWPRHDVWRYPVVPAYDRPVVLMSYYKGYAAREDFLKMMAHFSALAARYPNIPFLVKAKHALEVEMLTQIASQCGLKLNIIDTAYLPSVLCNARAVIGFHSAAMYEALLAPAPILIPRWGQTDQDPIALAPSPTDERLKEHMEFVRSPEALEQAVIGYIESGPPPFDMAARAKVFGEYFVYTSDRTGVERVEDFVAEFGRV